MDTDEAQVKLTDKSRAELEIDRAELSCLRQKLVQEKMALQGQLIEINARCRSRLPQNEFIKLQRQRAGAARGVAEKEAELAEVNARAREIQAVIDFKKRDELNPRRLIEFRDQWHDFSMDKRNDPVKRKMAWQFAQQLTDFLKPYFKPKEETIL